MSKKDKQVVIDDMDAWFANAGELITPLRSYQDAVLSYHKMMTAPDFQRDAQRKLARRHTSEFWKNDKPLPDFVRVKAGKATALSLFIALAVYMVLSLILGRFTEPETLIWTLFACGETLMAKFIRAIVCGVLVGVIAFACTGGVFLLRRRFKIASIKRAGEKMRDRIGYLPPKYRNAFCCEAVIDMHDSYGVSDFAGCVSVLDRHIDNNAQVYVPFSAMGNVPFAGAPEGVSTGGTITHDVNDPDLPDDIESHTGGGVENADEVLNSLIGLTDVKAQIRRLKNRMRLSNDTGTKSKLSGNNMVFLGPPGCGKTICARIVTKQLYDFGVIAENRIIEVDGDYLKSPYPGQTGARVSAICRWAHGGVLFVDEAYLLFGSNDDAGRQATGVLLKEMEDNRDKLVVILAGYTDGMERLLASNEGFSSRVRHRIDFAPYTAEELMGVFDLFVSQLSKDNPWRVEPAARDIVKAQLDSERGRADFGNAREARNALDEMLDIHADRLADGVEYQACVLTASDASAWLEGRRAKLAAGGHAFAARKHLDETIVSLNDLTSRTYDGSPDPDAELASLIGLDEFKQEVRGLVAQHELLGEDAPIGHMLFVGPPGCGKTTCASIVTAYLYRMGYIRENRYLSITGDFLQGSYVGHTGKRTEAVIEYSRGMVLFIDEAYLLAPTDETQSSFSAEAVGVLVAAMEKYKGELVVIMAGYTSEMNRLVATNPGLASRIPVTLHFQSFSLTQLCEIFRNMARAKGFAVEGSVYQVFANLIAPHVTDEQFGNARTVRVCVDAAIKYHALRVSEGQVADGHRRVIEAADLEGLDL